MKWTHLPAPGGLYDQHPGLLEDFLTIMEIEVKADEERNKREAAKQRGKSTGIGASRGRRR